MSDKNHKIQVFNGQKVRTAWNADEEKWYFSIVDVCWVLADSKDYQTARKYWNKLKQRLVEEENETVTNCHQLKMLANDGKMRLTDVALKVTEPKRVPSERESGSRRRKNSR